MGGKVFDSTCLHIKVEPWRHMKQHVGDHVPNEIVPDPDGNRAQRRAAKKKGMKPTENGSNDGPRTSHGKGEGQRPSDRAEEGPAGT